MVSTIILGTSVIGLGAASLGGYLETSVTRSSNEEAPLPSRTEISTSPMGQPKSLIFIHVSVSDWCQNDEVTDSWKSTELFHNKLKRN